MKTILVTGSTGFVGSNLVKELRTQKKYNIIGAVENEDGTTDKYQCNECIKTVSNTALLYGNLSGVDVVINCAFARSNNPALLADALNFTANLAESIKKIEAKSLINISSQGVYKRLTSGNLQSEDSEIEPIDMYSMAKYSAEQIFNVSKCAPFITNVRLASINMKQRFLYAFVNKIINNEPIVLTAPDQNAALLDVKDAVLGLISLAEMPGEKRKPIYNLGISKQMTILEYANIVVKVLKQYGYSGEIIIDRSKNEVSNSGMDCSLIMNDTGWRPVVTVEEMVKEYYKLLIQ